MMRSASTVALALSLVLASAAPVLADRPATAPAAATQVEKGQPARSAAAVDDDATRYAEREKPATEQKDYEGGDYVVIGVGAGTLIIVLLILLIVL